MCEKISNKNIYVKYGILSFQFIPAEISMNKDNEIIFISYFYYDTVFLLIVLSIISIIAVKYRNRRKAEPQDNSIVAKQGSESNVRL